MGRARARLAASPNRVDAAIADVAAELCVAWQAPGIIAPNDWAQAIATARQQPVIDVMAIRLHRLRSEPRLPNPAPGRARDLDDSELPLLREWLDAFARDVGDPASTYPEERLRALQPSVLVWENEGRPVSMARRVRPFHGGWSISCVYTPPELRGRGYAGAVVHALSARLLAEGARYVVLYTDLANPTSNRIYQCIGFAPESDQQRLLWQRER